MIQLPDPSQLAIVQNLLESAGYGTEAISKSLGVARPPRPGEEQKMLHRTRQASDLNTLIRLFLIGIPVDRESAAATLSDRAIGTLVDLGLVESGEERLAANVVIVPIEDMLFVSDAFRLLGADTAAEFVLPAHTDAARFLSFVTLRDAVDRCLDLGCGCGIQALLAARHSRQVVATDVSPSAVRYTEFNARLNRIGNVECLAGNLFEPVEGRAFDLIISNPPFVVSPGTDYVYRDNPMELDQFCKLILEKAPRYLASGGHLQLLCELVEIDGQPWDERVRDWVTGAGCDVWILKSPPRRPIDYVAQRTTDVLGPLSLRGHDFGHWLHYLEERDVSGIHPAMIVLRRRDAENWFNVYGINGDVSAAAGSAVKRHIEACDFLSDCSDEQSLLEATLQLPPDLELEQQLHRDAEGWVPGRATLRTADALPNAAELDLPIMTFLNLIDGRRPLGAVIADFTGKTGSDGDRLGPELLQVARAFVARGFLEPANLDA